MVTTEDRAIMLMMEAEKHISSSKGFFGSLFGKSAKIEKAIDCYQRAANLFKMTKNWERAGSAFRKAAGLLNKVASRHDAASSFVDAANCYKKSSVSEAENCLLQAIEICTDLGRFSMAAKHHQSIAEIYESDRANHEKVVQHYEQAADYYRGEEINSSANKCLLKVAQYSSELEDYEKAVTIYEQIAQFSLESPLLKYSAKEYMFKAALCHLCVDILNAQHAVQRFMLMFPAFQDSREFKLLLAIIEYIEEQNVDGFTDAVKEYDSISRFDPWHTMILLRIKRQLNDHQDLR